MKKTKQQKYLSFYDTVIFFVGEMFSFPESSRVRRFLLFSFFPTIHSYLSLSSMPHWWHVFVDISIAFWYVVHSWVPLRVKRPFPFDRFVLSSRLHRLLEKIGLRRASIGYSDLARGFGALHGVDGRSGVVIVLVDEGELSAGVVVRM